MRRPLGRIPSKALISGALLLTAIALPGCGSSGSNSASTAVPASTRTPPASAGGNSVIPLTSVAIEGGKLPARYTCDGEDIAPPLKWGTVPSASAEVVLFALGVTPGRGNPGSSSVEWAMAGLKPELHGVGAGELPSGAFLVQASNGTEHYRLCPPKGHTKHYEFAVYAMPPLVAVGKKISGVKLLQNLADGPPQYRAPGKGELSATYTRR
jgi:phosphatidylethanolamine-binding protein (PEBP) family uncharacterized protein